MKLISLFLLFFELLNGTKVYAALNLKSLFFQDCFVTTNECPNSNVTFWLYTRKTQENPVQLFENNLDKIKISEKRLVVLIHGYTGFRDFSPNYEIRPALLENENVAVISLDYGALAKEPCYIQAVKNAQTVGKCTANLLDLLVEKEIVPLEKIHVIGFSLGGQVAGIIGRNMKSGKLKRITGLDPAKPLFIFAYKKLDKSDAEFVDVIHTDVLKHGILSSMGHVDFYPNGGILQPGCGSNVLHYNGSCNHYRAPQFYAESIKKDNNGFWAYRCSSWINYVASRCRWDEKSNVDLMGYHVSEDAKGLYVLTTSDKSPFSKGKYPEAEMNLLTLENGETISEDILFNYNN